ncbi:NAD(P)H-hydrate dehydratase [Massilia glaciei]|uniref:Bifunctional NAD(P)H-hydrate repair enzyme n=1 Tax=Massilia glaciei TaxID=1524097 RepID=A0A2U2HGB8_9BURK|nr:NAD(P)H-hydrate dehydratase [Massilia glaciei]PWF43971.1 NAD(P)H-hydrate dehydratase [Massilia glaciei]
MKPLYSVAQIRDIETTALASLPPGSLMQRAGQSASELAVKLVAHRQSPQVLVLAGPGNNGGDALEVAANLGQAGIAVTVLRLAGASTPPDSARALLRARAGGVRFADALPADVDWALVVDGLFGIGLARALSGAARALACAVNEHDWPVLALDVPSGLDADTGALVGPDGVAVRAGHTITFIGDKPGLHTGQGRDYAGAVTLAGLGVELPAQAPAEAQLNEVALFARYLHPRAQNSHKGSFGNVAVIGGARGMLGAPVLAARGALLAGAGRVFVATLDRNPGLDMAQPELMFRDAAGYDPAGSTLVIGPGMGDSADALRLLHRAQGGAAPLVLDADALNLIAANPDLQLQLAQRTGATALTPHPLEAARLLGVTIAVIQGDRMAAARELAARLRCHVVLKGAGSVLARPDGMVVINPTGNPGLATAGTGDVLAGICGALLAQGWPGWEALLGAVWVHGAAADRLVAQGVGPIGLTAGELPAAARAVLNALVLEIGG